MLAGFRSRWTMSWAWAKASPSQICCTTPSFSSRVICARRRWSCFRSTPVEQLHGHEELVALDAELVDGDDVRVAEEGGGLRLPLEPLAHHLVRVEAGRDPLDRDVAVQDRVVGAEHLAHGPLAELADDLVLADALGKQLPRILPRRRGVTRR